MECRLAAIESLESLGTPVESAVAIYAQALSHSDAEIRFEAERCLGWHGTTSAPALPQLLDCLSNDPDANMRQGAAEALGEIGIGTPRVIDALREAKRDSNPHVRLYAQDALRKLGAE